MKAAVIWLLRGYQRWVSPSLPPACRYVPSCSEYAAEAVEMHGVLKGGLMGLWRLCRCHPLARGGYDPVACPGKSIDPECGAQNRGRALRMTPSNALSVTPSNEVSRLEFPIPSHR